ncbi:hypothetical protein C0992_006281 [Termitomyces sp. T32_za158]|nr:hypothetical protein C0992_006281 [Termitomyces sp. T32_za158]
MDDSPALVLVPTIPLKFDSSSSPITTKVLKTQPRARPSSETTIVSIYSMYGDDRPRTSWSASSVLTTSNRKSYEAGVIPTVKVRLPDGPRLSIPQENDDSELAYYNEYDTTHDSGPLSPPSSDLFVSDDTRESLSFRTSTTSSPISRSRESTNNADSSPSLRNFRIGSDSADRDLTLLPPLPPSVQSSQHASPSPTPPPQPSPAPSPALHPAFEHPIASIRSKVSLVPSEGEDVDAFHVRSTYAQLEAFGVKGDGFEDGIERTRARIGPSRSSQLNAFAALDDGTEKSKTLGPKELETLASVDRYGFFAVPSHDRLVLLTAAPLLKRLAPVRGGPASAPASSMALRELPRVLTPPKEMDRIAKWTRMMVPLVRDSGANVVTWGVRPGKEAKLRRRVYKGIPDAWRRASWDFLMARYSSIGAREMEALAREYREALDKPSTYDIQIDLDVPRTISGHIMFRTRYGAGCVLSLHPRPLLISHSQRSLFHVLHSFSLRCPKCGYVQGMGPIAATLLCYFDPEHVYASLVRLHDAYSLHAVFSPGFPGLLEVIYVQERITEQMMPDVFQAFKKHSISTTSYATKWYITLFSNSVPFQTQLRLWDAFLLEGYDVFIAVAVAIVWVYRDQITSSAANFETVLSLLSSFFIPEDEDTLMNWISRMLGDKKLRSNMRKWKADWQALVAAGKDSTALL